MKTLEWFTKVLKNLKAKTHHGNEFDIAKKCGNNVDRFGWLQRN